MPSCSWNSWPNDGAERFVGSENVLSVARSSCPRPRSHLFVDVPTLAPPAVAGVGVCRRSAAGAHSFLQSDLYSASTGLTHSRPSTGSRRADLTSFFSLPSPVELVSSIPPAALVPLHAAAILTAFPGTIVFELVEGYLLGLKKGFVIALAGKAVGALVAFWAARSALAGTRERMREQMRAWPMARAAAAGAEQGGGAFVFILRLSPVPCCVNNYAISLLTDIPWHIYVPASVLGLMPMTAVNVYAGAIAPRISELVDVGSRGVISLHALEATGAFVASGLFSLLVGRLVFSQVASGAKEIAPQQGAAEDKEEE
mmetsp:Transcript_73321/g.203415  ORF Transcript_73321/g.203415 Transcript_73321/m.203415 type:complete len:314 (+) Transcript_73321:101-1042(+)